MGLSWNRRFLNVVVAKQHFPGVKSLLRIDTARHLFYPTTPPPPPPNFTSAPPPRTSSAILGLPRPTFNFRASSAVEDDDDGQWKMDCFPVVDGMVICADQSGRAFLVDAATRRLQTMPTLHRHPPQNSTSISLFAPNAHLDVDHDHSGFGSTVYIMDKILKPEAPLMQSNQFEAFIFRKPTEDSFNKFFHRHRLPPPPFLHEIEIPPEIEISSYAVLSGSHICISLHGIGTYCLHTTQDGHGHAWSKAGDRTLPFKGKVEYVPEFNLWFGLSAQDQHLAAAAHLDAMETTQPQLHATWSKELHPPEEWKECKDSQLITLGSGRFCIARFFQATNIDSDFGDECVDNFAVLTGLEVSRKSEVELQMTPHKSRLVNTASIEALF